LSASSQLSAITDAILHGLDPGASMSAMYPRYGQP